VIWAMQAQWFHFSFCVRDSEIIVPAVGVAFCLHLVCDRLHWWNVLLKAIGIAISVE